MALEGTVNTPVGHISKKTAVIGGLGLAVLAGIVYYRSKKASEAADAAAAASTAGSNTGIDPSTGYAYGSAEDAAALAAQGSYVDPTSLYYGGSGGSGGGTSIPANGTPGPGSFTNNAQWAQYVEDTLVSTSQVADPTALSAAIGKYLTGQPLNGDQQSLVQQAIAFGGQPPQSGANGYPPSINTSGGTGTTPPTPLPAPVVTGKRSGGEYGFSVFYAAPAGASAVRLYSSGGQQINSSPASMNYIGTTNLKKGTTYTYYLAAVDSAGNIGTHSPNFSITTDK